MTRANVSLSLGTRSAAGKQSFRWAPAGRRLRSCQLLPTTPLIKMAFQTPDCLAKAVGKTVL